MNTIIFPISFAIAAAAALIGYGFIYCVEHKAKIFTDLLFPKTWLTKKTLYLITSINILYFGIGCVLMLFNVITF